MRFIVLLFFLILIFMTSIVMIHTPISLSCNIESPNYTLLSTKQYRIQTSGPRTFYGGSHESYQNTYVGSTISDKKWVRSKIVVKNVKKTDCTAILTKKWRSSDRYDASAEIGFKIKPNKDKKSCKVEFVYEIWIKEK